MTTRKATNPAAAQNQPTAAGDAVGLVRKIPALRWRTIVRRYDADLEHIDQDVILVMIVGCNEIYRAQHGRDGFEQFEQMPLEQLTEWFTEHNTPDEGAQKS